MVEADKKGAEPATAGPQILAALSALGRALSTISTYGGAHPLTVSVTDQAYAAFAAALADRNRTVLGASGGKLTVDGVPVGADGPVLKHLEKRLAELKVTGLTLRKELSREEFSKLLLMLAEAQGGDEGFSETLSRAGLTGVSAADVRYRMVREDEDVVKKTLLERRTRRQQLLDAESGGSEAPSEAETAAVHVEQVVAFLKGEVGAAAAEGREALEHAAMDPRRLAQMIMEAAAVRQGDPGLADGEGLNEIVFGFLRRTFDGLRQTPRFKDPRGQVTLKRSLMLLEKNIIDKMHAVLGRPDPETDWRITEAIAHFQEELDVERVASVYFEQREAVRRSEQQIVSYIQTRGVEAARNLVHSAGMEPAEWRRLVMRSRREVEGTGNAGMGAGAGVDIAAGMGTLAVVLEKLEGLMRQDIRVPEEVNRIIEAAHEHLDAVGQKTEKKIDALAERISGTIEGTANRMKTAELLTAIAEIAQELAQPLTAINTGTEMLLLEYAGEVNSEQRDLLQLSKGAAEHLHTLMDQLIEIVGFPLNRGVDPRFHKTQP